MVIEKKKTAKKSREGFFKRNYSQSWDYIKESRDFIYVIIGIFLLFVLVGFLVPPPANIELKILEFLEELFTKTTGMSQVELIRFILLNNLQVSFVAMILGLAFGIFPLISTIINGYILGYVSLISVNAAGPSILLNLVPHGIFEIPALFISLGLGLKLGTFIFEKQKVETLKKYLVESLRVFAFVIVPLLVIAAIIEGSLIFFGR